MLDAGVAHNIPDIVKLLTDVERKQVPYAMYRTINGFGFEARDHERGRLSKVFTIRKPGHLGKSITFRKVPYSALKSKAAMVGQIGTFSKGLRRLETGGYFASHKGQGWFVPDDDIREGSSFSGAVDKQKTPRRVMRLAKGKRARRKRPGKGKYARIRPFLVTQGKLKGNVMIRRFPDRRLPLVRLYNVSDMIDVPEQWGFKGSIVGISDKQLANRFVRELKKAMAGSKDSLKEPRFLDGIIESAQARNRKMGSDVLTAMDRRPTGVPSYSSPI